MRRIISLITILLCLSSVVFASDFNADLMKEYKENGKSYILNTYEVNEDDEDIFEYNIQNNIKQGLKSYELLNTSKTGGTTVTEREENQIKIVETNTEKIEDILRELPTEIEYDENGYTGKLYIDTSSVTTNKVYDGTYTKAYTVTETFEYKNLSENDLNNIPKTKVKNGITMNLVSADWNIVSTQMIGSSQIPTSYSCFAYYKGTGYQRVNGESRYTSSAVYKGTISRTDKEPLIYELTYVKIADYTWIVVVAIIGVVLLIAGIVIQIVQKKKKANSRRYY